MPVARILLGLLLAIAAVAVLARGGGWHPINAFPFLVVLCSLCLFLAALFAAARPLRIAGGPIVALALVPVGAMLIAVYADDQITIPLVGVILLAGIGIFLRGAGRLDPRRIASDLASPLEHDRARGMRDLRFLVRAHHQPGLGACIDLLEVARKSPDESVRTQAERILEEAGGTRRPASPLGGLAADAAPEAAPEPAGTPPPTVHELIEVLHAGEPAACREAVRRLVAVGPAAIPTLRTARTDATADVRVDIDLALAAIRGALADPAPQDDSV